MGIRRRATLLCAAMGGVALGACVLVGACSSFEPSDTPGTDAATADGSASEAAIGDGGGADAAALGCAGRDAAFCDDFEGDGPIGALWDRGTIELNGRLDLAEGLAPTPGRALRSTIFAGDGGGAEGGAMEGDAAPVSFPFLGSAVSTSLLRGPSHGFRVDLDLKVDAYPTEITLVTALSIQNDNLENGITLALGPKAAFDQAKGSFLITSKNPARTDVEHPFELPAVGRWTHFAYEADFDTSRVALLIDGVPVYAGSDGVVGQSFVTFFVGNVAVAPLKTPSTVAIDNVVVTRL